MNSSAIVIVLLATSVAAAQAPGDSPAAPAAPAPVTDATPAPTPPAVTTSTRPPAKKFGIGLKAGNGIGFFGADIVIDPIPHIGIDLQAAFMPATVQAAPEATESVTVFGIAPAIHGFLFDGLRSTPYMSVGMVAARVSLGSATSTAIGTFANIGYEWRWRMGLAVQLGGGVGYLNEAKATDGIYMYSIGGKWNPNLELGVRYFLF